MKTFAIALAFVVAGAALALPASLIGGFAKMVSEDFTIWRGLTFIGACITSLGILVFWLVLPITYAVRAVRRQRCQ